MTKVDILNLEHTSYSSRDTESASLVCNYLRMQGLNVVEGCVFQGYELLLRYRPRVLYITGVEGANINVKVAQFAKYLGCKVVSQCGEGIFKHRFGKKYYLGWLYNEKYPIDKWLLWNKRALDNFKEEVPEIYTTMCMAGSPGHDRYKIVQNKSVLQIPEKYSTVIGVGCWTWWPSSYKEEVQKDFVVNEARRFEQELKKIIEHCQDTYFLLKEHPGSLSHEDGGIASCINYPNVQLLKDESIFDCIAASDIWLTVESTTATEAWLLNKQTALLNPSGIDWPLPRQGFHLAQPNYPDADTWIKAIATYKKTGHLPGFTDFKEQQEELLCDIAGHADGLNHVRTGNIILDVLDEPPVTPVETTFKEHIKLVINSFLHWHFSKYHAYMPKNIPYFKFFEEFYKQYKKVWNQQEREQLSRLRYEEQLAFYRNCNLSLSDLRKIYS